jgi:hypothetical protein
MGTAKEEFISLGKRWGSALVLQEANESLTRWREDLPLLTRWGFGQTKLTRLETLVTELTQKHTQYQTLVGAKLAANPAEASAIETARTWVQRAQGILEDRIDADDEVAGRVRALGARIPEDASKLLIFSQGFLKIATEEREHLARESATDEFYKEGAEAIEVLTLARGQKGSRTDTKEVGTAELDLLDGQIYVELSKLYKKARQAHNKEGNPARASQYVFTHLSRSSDPKNKNEAVTTTPPLEEKKNA